MSAQPNPALDSMYQQIILDHYKHPQHHGLLEDFDAEVHHVNPTCGDEVTLRVKVEDGKVVDVSYDGQGCSISQASTSMMSAAVKGQTLDEVRRLIAAFKALMSIHESKLEGEGDGSDLADELEGVRLGDLEALQGVVKFPVRIKCATLAWNTLQQGLDEPGA
jgi:nitrogen fixation NifU-like protein